MDDSDRELQRSLDQHEAGVADLIAAYELAEQQYFAAVSASTPYLQQTVTSDSASWRPDANVG